MPKELIQAREDGDVIDEIEEFADEKEITRSEAVRRLIRTGLEAETQPTDTGRTHRAAQSGTVYFLILVGLLTLNLVASMGVI